MGVVKEHQTVIDAKTYVTKTFTAVEGLTLFPRLMTILSATTAAVLFNASDDECAKIMADPTLMLPMMISVADKAADRPDGLQVVRDLLLHTTCENVRVGDTDQVLNIGTDRFGTHFAADWYHLFRVAWWVARVSFASP